MDTKLLCPTLSVVLVKTIKALCEINIKYDNKLEITGSLHVRSDGQKVLTCLLDEETIKGQYDAARVAELAARLSMATASFPFTHLQLSTNVNHSQPALFSSIPGDVHQLDAQQQLSVGLDRTARVENEAANVVFQHNGKIPDGGLPLSDNRMVEQALRQQEELHQAVSNIQQIENARATQNSGDPIGPPTPTQPSRKRYSDFASKAFSTTKSNSGNVATAAISNYMVTTPDIGNLFTQPGGQNHVKLPDIQTLAHSLPKIHGSRTKTVTINTNVHPLIMPVATKDLVSNFSSPPAIASGISPTALPSLAPIMNMELEANQDLSTDTNASHKKKFQCMFCGIFLSTKCYLKNHINAMHTRARVYPCELCERYFYSAGALRIHKLRNHWQDSKKHVCAHCGETFLLPIELRKHVVKKHVGAEDQLLMDSVEMKLEDGELPMPHLQPEDVSLDVSSSSATPSSVCYQSVGEIDNPLTPNSNSTPPSLEASGGIVS